MVVKNPEKTAGIEYNWDYAFLSRHDKYRILNEASSFSHNYLPFQYMILINIKISVLRSLIGFRFAENFFFQNKEQLGYSFIKNDIIYKYLRDLHITCINGG